MKIYEKILSNKLIVQTGTDTLNPAQSGFIKGRSVHDHIFTLKQIINKTITHGKEVAFAFVDLEKAFDKIQREKVWECLRRRGMGEDLYKNVRSLNSKNLNMVIRKNMRIEAFKQRTDLGKEVG